MFSPSTLIPAASAGVFPSNPSCDYEELVHVFFGPTKEIERYRQRNGIEVPERATYERIVAKAQAAIMSRVSADGSYHRKKSDEELPEPTESP